MCGICGLVYFDGQEVRPELVNAMSETMAHRGPDGQGVWVKGSAGLGHRRLSIIDLSTGDQPMGTPDNAVQVVFNGEIYNFLELKKRIVSGVHRNALHYENSNFYEHLRSLIEMRSIRAKDIAKALLVRSLGRRAWCVVKCAYKRVKLS